MITKTNNIFTISTDKAIAIQQQPFFSIIIPVFNAEKFLDATLQSAINQTYKNIEIICIDDCSTDNSKEIIKKYQSNDNRIKLIENHKNCGVGCSRNKALKIALGRFICFLDADDRYEINACEIMHNYITKYNLDYLCFSCKSELYGETTQALENRYVGANKFYDLTQIKHLLYKCMSGPILLQKLLDNKKFINTNCFRVIQKELIQKNNITYIEGIVHIDIIFSSLTLLASKNAMYIEEQLYDRIIHAQSIMSATPINFSIKSYLTMLQELNNTIKLKPNNLKLLIQIEDYILNRIKTLIKKQ